MLDQTGKARASGDDTGAKVLALSGRRRDPNGSDRPGRTDRTGVFTSGIVSILGEHRVASFFTGRHHPGQNLATVLKERARQLGRPLQMCDALSRNLPDLPEEFQTIVAHCLAHARRQFVDVAMNFPDECLHVLLILNEVYTNDAWAKDQGLSPEQRPQDGRPERTRTICSSVNRFFFMISPVSTHLPTGKS